LTISGNNAGRVFVVGTIYAPNLNLVASISGLTVAGGSALVSPDNYGAGLLNFGTLTLSNVAFTGNAAGSSGGGAIYNVGALTVAGTTFSANTVDNGTGGGIYNTSTGTLAVSSSTFI